MTGRGRTISGDDAAGLRRLAIDWDRVALPLEFSSTLSGRNMFGWFRACARGLETASSVHDRGTA